jgi:mono/diheme cytochrome c family protein
MGRAAAGAVLGVMMLLCFWSVASSKSGVVQASSKRGRQAGAVLFHEKGCEHCHGVDGIGTDRAPSLTTVGKRRKKAQIEQQIEKGGNGMPAYGEVLQPEEVKWLVEFLHAKRKAPKNAPVVAAPTPSVHTEPSGSDPGL